MKREKEYEEGTRQKKKKEKKSECAIEEKKI